MINSIFLNNEIAIFNLKTTMKILLYHKNKKQFNGN